MGNGPTPHLEGIRGDYAPTVLVPGDPKRAKFIADNYLDHVKQVNSVRGADGFTGSIDGVPVYVQAVGMGIPSALIYYTELIRFYGVKRLIRVGSCGGLNESVRLGDLICASTAGTDSAAITQLNRGLSLPSAAHWELLSKAAQTAVDSDFNSRLKSASATRPMPAGTIVARQQNNTNESRFPSPRIVQFSNSICKLASVQYARKITSG